MVLVFIHSQYVLRIITCVIWFAYSKCAAIVSQHKPAMYVCGCTCICAYLCAEWEQGLLAFSLNTIFKPLYISL